MAVEFGRAGATVYATGRSVSGKPATSGRPETIDETADLVTESGGNGIAVRVDHTIASDVKALFDRVRDEQDGKLDILINDVWGGDELSEWGKPFWENTLSKGFLMQDRAVRSHIITAVYAAPLMVARKSGLIVEVTDGYDYSYRGNLFYSLAKASNIHLAAAMAGDLELYGVTALAVTPGFLRSEAMLDHFGVTEANWRDGVATDPHFIASETPYFLARCVVKLARDPNIREERGKTLTSLGHGAQVRRRGP
jgi:NAD(P)-dependent dehydrogenase (short-subunit alcohol dehydrogenase family)